MSSVSSNAGEQAGNVELADVIARRKADIEQRWLTTVQAEVRGREHVSITDLRDAMPDYLERLTESLRTGREATAERGTAIWAEIAREHAVTRVRLGFDIDELVHEFIVLRNILLDVAREEGLATARAQEAKISGLIDAAIAVSVTSYVEHRDYQMRQREAEHIGFITHELRNPLTTATIISDQLARTLRLTEEQQRRFDVMRRSLQQLGKLIDSVLLVERMESGKTEPNMLDITLGELLHEPLVAADTAARAKGIAFEARFDPDVLVRVDQALATSAVSNVLDNATKFTDFGVVRLEVETSPAEATLHVRDNCEGLSQDELRTIFEPFRRGHTHKPGTGMGLAIARRALEAQGGTIHAEAGEDRGCHFVLTLPRPHH